MTDLNDDISAASAALSDILEGLGCHDGQFGPVEPMMGGFLATAEFDDAGSLGETDGIRIVATEIREYRHWSAISGRLLREGWNLAMQGEFGTYGPMSDAPDILRMQIWIGRAAVPGDIEYAFDLEHDRLVATSAVTRLYMAASALAAVSDEVVDEVSRIGTVPAIANQIERLTRTK